ncbi:MAG TPA: hypothetical protein VF178_09890 [Gemmatimonadaceae bacterium]
MRRFVRSMLIASSLCVVPAATLAAQGKSLELRTDMVAIENADDNTEVTLVFPGSFAMAFYMNEYMALEPGIAISHLSDDDDSGTIFSLGFFVPIHIAPTMGRTGVFLAPGIQYTKGTGDFEFDGQTNYGLDVGIKTALRERISMRFAVTFRDGDSYDDPGIGATFGFGFFWR